MRKGSTLLLIIFIFSVFAVLAALFVKIVYNYSAGAHAALVTEQAFYLAEAGLEKGKVELVHNPNWYTDLPSSLEDSADWLVNYAVGQTTQFGEGSFKVVREKGKDSLYAVGLKGKGVVVLKLKFSNPPFKSLEWGNL